MKETFKIYATIPLMGRLSEQDLAAYLPMLRVAGMYGKTVTRCRFFAQLACCPRVTVFYRDFIEYLNFKKAVAYE